MLVPELQVSHFFSQTVSQQHLTVFVSGTTKGASHGTSLIISLTSAMAPLILGFKSLNLSILYWTLPTAGPVVTSFLRVVTVDSGYRLSTVPVSTPVGAND